MRYPPWFRAIAFVALVTLLVTGVTAALPKKDPPGTSAIMGQLRSTFALWDLDGDGYLDKGELARAFRGAEARPYDYKPTPRAADKKDDDKPSDGDKKDSDTSKGSDSSSRPDYTKYPDYNFLVALDSNSDEKISKDEFESWARDYAVTLKQQLDAIQRVAAAEQKLAAVQNASGKKAAKELRAAEADLKREQLAYKKMTQNAKSYDRALLQALKQSKKP